MLIGLNIIWWGLYTTINIYAFKMQWIQFKVLYISYIILYIIDYYKSLIYINSRSIK